MKQSHESALQEMEKLKLGKPNKKGIAYLNPIRKIRFPISGKFTENFRLGFVPLDSVVSHQNRVFREDLIQHILRQKTKMQEPLPAVYHCRNMYHVINGNHRIVAMMLKGRVKMRMRIYE